MNEQHNVDTKLKRHNWYPNSWMGKGVISYIKCGHLSKSFALHRCLFNSASQDSLSAWSLKHNAYHRKKMLDDDNHDFYVYIFAFFFFLNTNWCVKSSGYKVTKKNMPVDGTLDIFHGSLYCRLTGNGSKQSHKWIKHLSLLKNK